jgi:integrase
LSTGSWRGMGGVFIGWLYQLRKTAFTAMASQTDLKTLMEFTGHTQVSTVMGSSVFATTETMAKAVNGMDQLRPR